MSSSRLAVQFHVRGFDMSASRTDGRPADTRFSRWQAECGQTMVEYGFVLVAIAVAAIAAYQVFGGRVSDLVNTVNIA